jgi:hypothetical protein
MLWNHAALSQTYNALQKAGGVHQCKPSESAGTKG